MGVTVSPWGTTPQDAAVERYTLKDGAGFTACVSTYGAALTELHVPCGENSRDVVLGFDSLDGYLADARYFGRMVGRFANRIRGAAFELDGVRHDLDRNNGRHHLHGGSAGLHNKVWSARQVGEDAVEMNCFCPDGESGYPGELEVTVIYALTGAGLRIECRAQTDRPTPVSLTNHSYFNLGGKGGHDFALRSERVLLTDDERIPTGDFRGTGGVAVLAMPGSAGCDGEKAVDGFDEYHVLSAGHGAPHVVVRGGELVMELFTTQPGVQVYSGGFIPSGTQGKGGAVYGPGSGFCLETQAYPDAPNRPEFPSAILRPGEIYEHATEYRFRQASGRCETNTGE